MLNVEERFMIRSLHRKGVTISEIARRTGHDRKTVRKSINDPFESGPKARKTRKRKIDPYIPYLKERMAAGVFNAHKLYQEILEMGYPGKESMVRAFVHPYRPPLQAKATVRFETMPGQQAQVDWAHFGFIQHQGRQRRLYAFLMTLGWSRAMYLEFTVSTIEAWWLRCHVHAFHYLGGVPKEMLHDNLKTAVLERRADGSICWHPRYLDFADYYGFAPRACQPYRAQTKGKVESGVRYVRGNFWPGLEFTDLADLNHQAIGWLNNVANVRIHGTTGEVPFDRLLHEQLASLHERPDYNTDIVTQRKSSRDCLVSYEGSFYSVPAAYAGQRLTLHITEEEELLVLNRDGMEITRHPLASHRGQRRLDPAHYKDVAFSNPGPRLSGATQVPHADLAPRTWPDAPVVDVRPLSLYEQIVEESA